MGKEKNFFNSCQPKCSNGIYGLGLIGSLVYFFQHAASFGDVIFGFLKAILWPAFLIYELMKFLQM